MAILFKCQNCQIQLSVPDNATGNRAQCGQCDHVNTVPVSSDAIVQGERVEPTVAPIEMSKRYSVKSAVNGAVFGPADMETLKRWHAEGRITPNCQFQEEGAELWAQASQMFSYFLDRSPQQNDNPFQSPVNMALADGQYLDVHNHVICNDQVIPRRGDLRFCFSHSTKVWQDNFGLLLGAFAIVVGVGIALSIPVGLVNEAFPAFSLVAIATKIIHTVVLGLLSIGFIKMFCQLARRKRGQIKQLFEGSKNAMLALLYVFLANLPVDFIVSKLSQWAIDIPTGVMPTEGQFVMIVLISVGWLLFSLFTWPIYYLLIDTDLGMKSIPSGAAIGLKNVLQSLVIWSAVSMIIIGGLLFCLVGTLFTSPLAFMLQVVAYLNMSGQLEPHS